MYEEAAFSPGGRWLADKSEVSGRNEIYVQPFPGPGKRRMISTKGGITPVWSRDGRELFYSGEGSVMAVSFSDAPNVDPGEPKRLFEAEGEFDVAPDGRFLMIRYVKPRSFNVVLNWFEELERLVPDED